MTCKDCIHAQWELTVKGQIKRTHIGECTAKLVDPAKIYPACAQPAYSITKSGILPDMHEGCALYYQKGRVYINPI